MEVHTLVDTSLCRGSCDEIRGIEEDTHQLCDVFKVDHLLLRLPAE